MRSITAMTEPTPIRVASLLPVLGHPRDSKRISMLQSQNVEVEVAAFERSYHAGRMPACPITKLGFISHGRYGVRIFKFLRALPRLRGVIKRCDAVYASGPDMALAAIVASVGLGKPVILEIGDIRRLQVATGLAGKLMRCIDWIIARRCSLLISTARGFVDGYYRERLNSQIPVMILENKLDSVATPNLSNSSDLSSVLCRPIRIGWFGVLRCPWSWEILSRLAREFPDRFEVLIAGHPLDPADLPVRVAEVPGVRFIGEYRSPGDLPALYGQVDLVWAVYPGPDVTERHWRWALLASRSNRYYESCQLRRPIITLAESGDGEEVVRLDHGLALRSQRFEDIAAALLAVSPDDLLRWRSVLEGLPLSVHSYTDEAEILAATIRRIVVEY